MADLLETRVAKTNADFFLREFSFSETPHRPDGASEIEIADHVVAFGDVLLLFQLKNRQQPTTDPKAEAAWFSKKVIKKGTKQIRDTLSYLRSGSVRLDNERGHATDLPADLKGLRLVKAVVYDAAPDLPQDLRRKKIHSSQSGGGAIHLLAVEDYEGVLHTFVTLPEIVEYFEWRERMAAAFPHEIDAVIEPALVGQFLDNPELRPPIKDGLERLKLFRNDVEQFEIFGILHKFKEKSELGQVGGSGGAPGREYYRLLSELVQLPRTELAAFKERFMLAWDKCGGDLVQPYRFTGVSGCAFVFIPVPAGHEHQSLVALRNYTYANRYDLQQNRGVGIAFRRDGEEHRLIVRPRRGPSCEGARNASAEALSPR